MQDPSVPVKLGASKDEDRNAQGHIEDTDGMGFGCYNLLSSYMLYIKWFADILGYTNLSYINFESSSKFSTLECSSLWGYARLIPSPKGFCSGTCVGCLKTLAYSLPWLRAGLPDPCVFWSSGGRHLSVGLILVSKSWAKAEPVHLGVSEQSMWLRLWV